MWSLILHNITVNFDEVLVAFTDMDGRDIVDDRLKIVSPRRAPVYRNEQSLGFLCTPGSWCRYNKVLAGYGGMGIEYFPTQSTERFKLYEKFRIQSAAVLGYQYRPINRDFSKECDSCRRDSLLSHVLIVQRYGNRAFSKESVLHMESTILNKYPGTSVSVQYFENASLEEQASLMQSISLMIAVDGTALDNALFMPPCTAVIAVGRDVLNSEQYILNDGFEMHTDHINIWNQALLFELIESTPGSWSDPRGRGPLGELAWRNDMRSIFSRALDRVVEKRIACALRRGFSSSFRREPGDEKRPSHFPRKLFEIRKVLTPSDFDGNGDVVGRVELVGESNWYEVKDFWRFSISSSIPFIESLNHILASHISNLVNDKNVFVINSGDGFIPLVSFFGRCKTLEVLETLYPQNVSLILGLFNALFEHIKIFFQHLLRVDIYNTPNSFLSRNDIDTLFVFSGALTSDICSCASGNICSVGSLIPFLAEKTQDNLVLEVIPQSCVFSSTEGIYIVMEPKELEAVEESIRKSFLSFHLAGYINTTCSFIYIATQPLRKVHDNLFKSTVQGLISYPLDGAKLALRDKGTLILRVTAIVTGPLDVVRGMRVTDRSVASEVIDRESIDDYVSPRLFVERKGSTDISGCFNPRGEGCFGNYTTEVIGNLYFLSYAVPLVSPGQYDVTFQLLRYSTRIYKAHFTPELVSQHSVTVYTEKLEVGSGGFL